MQLENLFNVVYSLQSKNETVEWRFLDIEPFICFFLIDLQ